jgi:preprotein translocase subunit SecF
MKTKLTITWFIFLAILLAMTSCSARKTAKSQTKEETKQTEVVTEVVTQTTNENTKIVDSSEIDEIEVTPIDSTKEMVIDGKKYFNAKIKKVKRKNNIVVDKIKIVDYNAQKDVNKVVEQTKKTNVKQTEKEAVIKWWWWIILIIILYLFFRYVRLNDFG